MQLNSPERSQTNQFRVRFWGVRGSYPVSNPKKLRYGGHTSCVEVEADGHRLIFDAGTGIIPLGKRLLEEPQDSLRLCIFLSHTHHDHLIGLYFFEPLLKETTSLSILGPESPQQSLKSILQAAMDPQFFPIGLEELKARKRILSLHGGERIRFRAGGETLKVEKTMVSHNSAMNEVTIDVHKSHAHPKNGVLLYRVNFRGKSAVYATDVEEIKGGYNDIVNFARDTDLLIHDAQYLTSEYLSSKESRKGWGHSTIEMAAEVAKKAAVKRLVLFHHEPMRDDKAVSSIERQAKSLFPASLAAYEGMEFDLFRGN